MGEEGVGDVVRAAAGGDESSWFALVDRFASLVWAVTRSFGLESADAADVSQVTWMRLVENLERLHEPDRVGAWLVTTARRECLRVLRQRGRAIPVGDDPSLDAADLVTLPPVHHLATTERNTLLWRAVSSISSRCQQLLRVLMADPPPSYEEVSAALDMPVGSIGPTRARCLDQLRRVAVQFGITADSLSSVE
ncbi:MAG: RNA polymerase sigma factor [Acidimicrobiales bacterium]